VSVQLLEALHQVESNASPDDCIANLEGSGATGPFQFKPATFSSFGVDANHDGVADICGFADSLFSAARYLRAIGADEDPTSATSRRALARYGTDVERVVSLARAYQERDGLLARASAPVLASASAPIVRE
jgi:membrane-bound lytic murein transglycosylase B